MNDNDSPRDDDEDINESDSVDMHISEEESTSEDTIIVQQSSDVNNEDESKVRLRLLQTWQAYDEKKP